MIDGEELSDHAAHGVPANNCLLNIEVVQQGGCIFGKHFDRISLDCFARFAGPAIIEKNDPVVTGKFPDLMEFPCLVIAPRHTAKEKGRSFAMNFEINFTV